MQDNNMPSLLVSIRITKKKSKIVIIGCTTKQMLPLQHSYLAIFCFLSNGVVVVSTKDSRPAKFGLNTADWTLLQEEVIEKNQVIKEMNGVQLQQMVINRNAPELLTLTLRQTGGSNFYLFI